MNLISLSIHRPIAVIAVVFMVLLFGYVALQRIPIQLAPDVRQPVIIVQTFWPGAAPAEVEREVVNRQEDVLKGLEGVRTMESRSRTGRAEVTLEFGAGQNMDRALLLVANRLDRVTGYPLETDEPILKTSGTEDNAIAWFLLTREPGNERDLLTYGDFLEDVVQERIERIVHEYRQQDKLKQHALAHRRKILLIGPPGTGKTMTARVLAHELRLPLHTVQVDRMVTKFMGETAAKLRQVFDLIQQEPGVYLFDEFDAIGGERTLDSDVGEMRRVLSALLQFI